MPQESTTLDDDEVAFVEDLAAELDISKSRAIAECIRAQMEGHSSLLDSTAPQSTVPQSNAQQSTVRDLEQRIEANERRIAELEEHRTVHESTVDDSTVDDSTVEQSTVDAPDDVGELVAEIAGDWDDSPDRLEERKAAATAVLQHAIETGEAVGKSDAIETFYGEFGVMGQSEDTWWRQNVRPVLKEWGDYSQGEHGYVVSRE